MDPQSLHSQAIDLLREACCSYGILASPEAQDNYRRLWARDSMVAGLAGLLAGDELLMEHWKRSLLTLAEYQHEHGMIPSNVLPGKNGEADISYGSLAGRVDATTWFMVGAGLYMLNSGDKELKDQLKPALDRALDVLDRWEFNAGNLLYTPLSGNWADEYPVEGHTLYDNLLRLWGLQLYQQLYEDEELDSQIQAIRKKISVNFWPRQQHLEDPLVYHRRCFEESLQEQWQHFACSITPKGYNRHFDAAGHALALLLNVSSEEQNELIAGYLESIFEEIGAVLVPAFWPAIRPEDPMWNALKNNFSYNFKNLPHHFHNGGIWPVWMGLLGLGLQSAGKTGMSKRLLQAWMEIEDPQAVSFSEYITSDTLRPEGKQPLSYSASGLIFLLTATTGDRTTIDKLYTQTH